MLDCNSACRVLVGDDLALLPWGPAPRPDPRIGAPSHECGSAPQRSALGPVPRQRRPQPLASAARGGHTRRVSRTYTRAEADEILRRALSEQSADGIAHDDLLAAAREVGIPEASIEAAAAQLGEYRLVQDRVELIRRRKRRAFFRHLVVYVLVNAGIFFVDQSDGGAWFFQYPLIVWGIILVLFGMTQLAPDKESLARKAERELERERRRESRRLRRGPPRMRIGGPHGVSSLPEGAREFEAAVQEGVSALLNGAARAIRGFTQEGGRRMRVEDQPASERDAAGRGSDQAKSRQTR